MKKISFAMIFALLATALLAQENQKQDDELNTLFGKGNEVRIGWVIGPNGGYTRFGSSDVGKRYTPDLDLINTSEGFINSFTANASLKFGKF